MAKCLRCGAGNEWIQGRVPDEPAVQPEVRRCDQRMTTLLGVARCTMHYGHIGPHSSQAMPSPTSPASPPRCVEEHDEHLPYSDDPTMCMVCGATIQTTGSSQS